MSALLGPMLMTDVQEVCLGDLEGNQGVTYPHNRFGTVLDPTTSVYDMHRWLAEDGLRQLGL